ncbi:helix-turn-helix transcriptional regulator [Variovorax sp. CAN2819]|uniref:helix-turn-helix transcriptional regulator n=1 Tax=Variovorax sp. CAN15 TaxID=3046727 RepID=UPI002648A866|nr:helix-turn-helix transcriptional regulator [Variovorax sp. CAN15]MDN6888002.1 helix-turn-helix transcriptional regulator [Variovorax sp. CAN15]
MAETRLKIMLKRHEPTNDLQETLQMLGARLRSARKARKWTQADVASLLGVSIPTYYQLEQGKGTSALWLWVAAMRLLDLSI